MFTAYINPSTLCTPRKAPSRARLHACLRPYSPALLRKGRPSLALLDYAPSISTRDLKTRGLRPHANSVPTPAAFLEYGLCPRCFAGSGQPRVSGDSYWEGVCKR